MPGTDRTAGPAGSIIIPAHDEAAGIERCLSALRTGAADGEFEVIVVANGCTDDTAERARRAGGVTVLELEQASKSAALNAGDEAASVLPRAYIDADVVVSAEAVRAVVALLGRGEVHCAAPRMRVELDGRPWYVRSFFRAYQQLPYVAHDMVGHGFYALSAEGRARFDRFPDVTGDDLFIRNLFTPAERRTVDGHHFTIFPPRRLEGLLAVRQRTYRGNREYVERGFRSAAEPTRDARSLLSVARRRPFDFAVYTAVNVAAKVKLSRQRGAATWERDESGRTG